MCVGVIKELLVLWSRFLERHSLPCPCVSDPHRHVSVLFYNTHTLMSHEGIERVEQNKYTQRPSYQHTLGELEYGNDVISSVWLSRPVVLIPGPGTDCANISRYCVRRDVKPVPNQSWTLQMSGNNARKMNCVNFDFVKNHSVQ